MARAPLNIDLCRDCQKQSPAFVGGVAYKRCIDCLEAFARKREENRQMKYRRFHARMEKLG